MNKNEKIINILEKIDAYYPGIAITTLIIQLYIVFKPAGIIIPTILVFTNFLLFLITKDITDKKNTGFNFFRISVVFYVYNILSIIFFGIEGFLPSGKSVKPMFLLLSFGIGIGIFSFFINDSNKKKMEKIKNIKFLNKIGIKTTKSSDGDVMICRNKETKEEIRIPYKDRFLHMLILGPTGSGKTSQVLIPMIYQDIKNNQGITVIEPKGDLAEKVFALGEHYGRKTIYFNPTKPDCPYFNPLYGQEDEVIENMATTFKMLNPDSPQFFQDMNETLIRNSLRVLKRLKGDSATLIDLSTLIYNSQGQGKIMVNQFSKLGTDTVEMAKENAEIASWFLSDYFNERSKTYEHCSGLRSQVSKITSNVHLRRVLNPPNGENDVDFEKILDEGSLLSISTAQGDLRDLGRFLGYFIILNFQSAVFKRPGNENTRKPHFLYIDEFQSYSTPSFGDMLTQGRSYKVASHLATQNRALMAMGGGRDGQNFVKLVSTNARNLIIFPGGSAEDAKYYSDEFGEMENKQVVKSRTRTIFNPLYGIKKLNYPSESLRENTVVEPRFSPSEIIYQEFGEIIYKVVQNNTVQLPEVGVIEFIPAELNNKLDVMVENYNEKQKKKMEKILKNTSPEDENFENVEDIDVVIPKRKRKEEEKQEKKERKAEVRSSNGEDKTEGSQYDDMI